ncbi:MAG: two-component system NtrC family sensor kinase [Cellvibrionaceae bacterium]|jgi:two-component system NtrC family sensor kinase
MNPEFKQPYEVSPDLENAHVLVVDDQLDIRETLMQILEMQGYTTSGVETGQEALQFLIQASVGNVPDRKSVDLVLLDLLMPNMNGLEVLRQIRGHPTAELRDIRVIMLTAIDDSSQKIDALIAGANDYITKPFHSAELLARAQTLLRSQKLEKELMQQREQFAMLNRVGQELSSTFDMRAAYRLATNGLRQILNVEAAALFVQLKDKGILLCHHLDLHEDTVQELGSEISYPPVPLDSGIIASTITRPAVMRVNDPHKHTLFDPQHDSPPGLNVRSILSLPVLLGGGTWGVIAVFNKIGSKFNEFDVDLTASFSTSLANTIHNAYLVKNLQQNRNSLQAIIDGILHPIYTVNERWELVAVNQARATEIGEDAGSLTGRHCFEAFYNRDIPCEHCLAHQTIHSHFPRVWSHRWRGEDHLPREWDINAYPLPSSRRDTSVAKTVVVWQDRTEEKRLEDQLIQTGKLAAIGQLSAGVAHEISNPLVAVIANAEMLKMSLPKDSEDYESADLILQGGERAQTVVKGLLDFAREQQYTFKRVDLNDSIQLALNLVSYQLRSAQVELTRNFSPELPRIGASPEHIKSVWINLMINARDAMRDAGAKNPHLEIITRPAHDDNQFVEVVFIDNGPGISNAQTTHIFEPFYTTKDPGSGTGLGLATCLRIVNQHGGTIELTSSPGEGATFLVRLPIRSKL